MGGAGSWILFPSVTYANKARHYLGQAGIHTRMERIPETVMGKTCGYRLLVSQENLQAALDICSSKGIRITKTVGA